MEKDIRFMSEALKEAKKAVKAGEVPVGCVIVNDGKIIARAHNLTVKNSDPSAHAEIIAIRKAGKKLRNFRLTNCGIYVTIEPCAMCAGAIVLARLKTLCFGAADPKAGACGSVLNVAGNKHLNHSPEILCGALERECSAVITDFFRQKRKKGAK